MSKPTFQDVIPPAKKTIRDIPLPPKKRVVGEPEETPVQRKPIYRDEYVGEPKKRGYLWLTVLILAVLGGGYFVFSTFFAGATLKIVPKQTLKAVSVTATASKDSSAPLGFNIITIEKSASMQVKASSTASISRKASGTITIFNSFSSAPQPLVQNTRFETQNGLIYRTQAAVTVPGKTTQGGKDIPGTIDVVVVADQAGDKYNLNSADFTIPGFKSDPSRYAAFSAKTKSPISGGFVGIAPLISDQSRAEARATLGTQLKSSLSKDASSQIPNDFVLFPDSVFISTSTLADSSSATSSDQSVVVNEKATLYGVIFNKDQLARYIANKTLEDFDSDKEKVAITDISNLTFAMAGNKDLFNPSSSPTITFMLNGNATFVWQFDQVQLKKDLAGLNKNSIQSVLSAKYPAIERIQVVVKPFWSQTIPTDTKKILVDF